MFTKHYLLSYKSEEFQALTNDCGTYVMQIQVVWFWGLFKTRKVIKQTIPLHASVRATFDKWDELIRTKKALT